MLDRAGVTEDDLGCPPALPMNDAAKLAVLLAADGQARARIYMNCSGKHAGMLTACVAARLAHRRLPRCRPSAAATGGDEVTRLPARNRPRSASTAAARRCSPSRCSPWPAASAPSTAAAAGTPERSVADAMRAHPGDGRRDGPGGHPADAGLPGAAGQGRRRGRALRGPAGRPMRRGEDHRRRGPGPDAGAGRRAAPARRGFGRDRQRGRPVPLCWTSWGPASCWAAACRSAPCRSRRACSDPSATAYDPAAMAAPASGDDGVAVPAHTSGGCGKRTDRACTVDTTKHT